MGLSYPPPIENPPPPSLYCFAGQYLLQWFVFPIAWLSHYFESVTCVYSVIFSLQRRCTGYQTPPHIAKTVTRAKSTKILAEMWRNNSVNGCSLFWRECPSFRSACH